MQAVQSIKVETNVLGVFSVTLTPKHMIFGLICRISYGQTQP